LFFGSHVGSAAGAVIAAIFEVEGATYGGEAPRWVWLFLVLTAVAFITWSLLRHA
jgi:hypothetical protein